MQFKKMFVTKDFKNSYKPEKPVKPRCRYCGLRKRGPNHEEGEDHQRRSKGK